MAQIALVDDHRLFSSALALALEAQGLDVAVPRIITVPELYDWLVGTRPDILLLDRDLGPAGNGEELIAPASASAISVVVLAARLDETIMGRCLAQGAKTCIPKSTPLADVLATVMALAHGAYPDPAGERERLIEAWRRSDSDSTRSTPDRRFARLTPSEAAVLAQLIEGHRVKAIAAQQHVSRSTVRTHVRSIHRKLGVTGQLEAVALAGQVGWRHSRGE